MTGARKGRVDGLEMRDDRIGRTTKDAGALEIVPELGEWELKRADEIFFVPICRAPSQTHETYGTEH